jgi:hypothetical protein
MTGQKHARGVGELLEQRHAGRERAATGSKSAALASSAQAETGPLSGAVIPILIVLSSAPGSYFADGGLALGCMDLRHRHRQHRHDDVQGAQAKSRRSGHGQFFRCSAAGLPALCLTIVS